MNNKTIINLNTQSSNTDAATKKYVDYNFGVGDIDLNNKTIINLNTQSLNTDAATKKYVDYNFGVGDIDLKDSYRIRS